MKGELHVNLSVCSVFSLKMLLHQMKKTIKQKESQPDSIVQANTYSSPTSQNQFVANLFQPLEFGYNKKEQVFILKNL